MYDIEIANNNLSNVFNNNNQVDPLESNLKKSMTTSFTLGKRKLL